MLVWLARIKEVLAAILFALLTEEGKAYLRKSAVISSITLMFLACYAHVYGVISDLVATAVAWSQSEFTTGNGALVYEGAMCVLPTSTPAWFATWFTVLVAVGCLRLIKWIGTMWAAAN